MRSKFYYNFHIHFHASVHFYGYIFLEIDTNTQIIKRFFVLVSRKHYDIKYVFIIVKVLTNTWFLYFCEMCTVFPVIHFRLYFKLLWISVN